MIWVVLWKRKMEKVKQVMQYGLKNSTIESIMAVFASFPEIGKVVLYGSRAKGNYKPGSDIDLTFYGDRINTLILNKISLALDDLLLPYTFDLSVYSHIDNPDLIDHIQRAGVIFYHG
jgi:predicted nucleotidyltransferase